MRRTRGGASPQARRCCTHDGVKTLAAALLVCALTTSCANIECSINSECGQHARCEMNRCLSECAEDRDCEDGFTCNRNGLCVEAPKVTTDRPEPQDVFTPADRGTIGTDVRTDVGVDAGTVVDTGTDIGTDIGTDAGFDAGTIADIATDSGVENRPDAGFDSGFDSGFDVGFDSGFDVGFPDRGVDVPTDTGARDSGAPDVPVVTGPAPVGVYEYTAVRPDLLAAPVAVAWHPAGSYALILSSSSTVFRYDVSTRAVTRVGVTTSTVAWRDVVFTPDGARALLLANTTTGSGSSATVRGRIFIWDHATGMLAERTAEASTTASYQSLRWSPDGSRAMLLTSGPSSIVFWPYSADGTRTGTPFGYGISSGRVCNDFAWVPDGFGDPALMVVCGTNGADILSATMLDSASPQVRSLMLAGQIGNVSRIVARPQGDVALTVGWSGQRLYRYRAGVWAAGFSAPMVIGAFGVAFSSDGARAVAFGGAGRVYEYRYELFATEDITDVRMGDLTMTPYLQPSSVQLNGMAWRPRCHAGLAVGGSGSSAFVAYFRVLNGVRCADDP